MILSDSLNQYVIRWGGSLYCENPLCAEGNNIKHELEKCNNKINGSVRRYFGTQWYRCPRCKTIFYRRNVCSDIDEKTWCWDQHCTNIIGSMIMKIYWKMWESLENENWYT